MHLGEKLNVKEAMNAKIISSIARMNVIFCYFIDN